MREEEAKCIENETCKVNQIIRENLPAAITVAKLMQAMKQNSNLQLLKSAVKRER